MHRVARPRLLGAVALGLGMAATLLRPAATAFAATTNYAANCPVNLRGTANTSGALLATISTDTVVTATGTVAGGSWSATCVTAVSGSSWYTITAVSGHSVSSLYGVGVVYAATGLFRVAPPPSTYVEGIDVSGWQGTIDFNQVKAAGKRFVIAKATEGNGFTDKKYLLNKAGAMAAGLAFTGYDFARPDLDGTTAGAVAEADWFVSQLGLVKGMLPPTLDLETHGTLGVTALQNWVGAWLDEVYAKTGFRPMIYVSPSFWSNYLGNTRKFADAGYTILWIAHWFVANPTVPASNWGGHGWTFWQYDDCGHVAGITTGCVDLDRFHFTDFTPYTFGADFAVSADPTSATAKQGAAASYPVSIARTFFTMPVSLSVTGLPPGATATFDTPSTTGTGATLSITTSASGTVTPVGTYPITITGAGNGLTHNTPATLVVTDGTPPAVAHPRSQLTTGLTLGSSTTPVRTLWFASDPSGVSRYWLDRSQNGGSWTQVGLPTATSTTIVQSLTFGATYRYFVKASDPGDEVSAWFPGTTFKPLLTQQTSSAVTWGGSWVTNSSSAVSGGSLRYSTAKGASASYRFNGSSISWVGYLGPTRGSAAVYIDGVLKATIDEYSPSYSARAIVYAATWSVNATHTIKIVNLGTAGHSRVDVDAFVRLVLQ